ncbi:MAG: trigger factor [Oscillospiraceae bacterium]|nr:trigger factor [Oscillospiraceae bacterium]
MIVKNIEKKEDNTVSFQVSCDAAEFEKALNAAYLKAKKNINIPGFRKGKAPRAIIEGMYGSEVFYQDAMDELAPAAFDLGVKEGELNIVGAPAIKDVNVTEEKGVEYTFSAEIYPAVTLGQYKGLEAERPVREITDEDVASELESARKRNARKITVEDRAAQMGDFANIDFDGFLNGERFDGGKSEGYELELGSNSFVPGFEEQIVGMKIGEEKDLDITFPQEYTPELAGKAVVFKVKLNGLSYNELPALDDDFAGDNGFDTLDEYKADVRANIEKRFNEQADSAFRSEIVKKAIDNMSVAVPNSMIASKVEDILRNYAANFGMTDRNMPVEKIMEMLGVDENMMNLNIRPAAVYQVKNDLLLEAVAEEEKIEATAEEIDEYVKKMAEGFGATAEQLKSYFGEEVLAAELKKEKAGKLIVDSAVAAAPAAEEEKKPAPKKRASKKAAPKAEEAEEAPKTEEAEVKPKRTRKKAEPKAEEEKAE